MQKFKQSRKIQDRRRQISQHLDKHRIKLVLFILLSSSFFLLLWRFISKTNIEMGATLLVLSNFLTDKKIKRRESYDYQGSGSRCRHRNCVLIDLECFFW